MKTHNCPPTLTDRQVLEFCKNGFLMLEGVVSDEINKRTLEYLEGNTSGEPIEILHEDWFMSNVIQNSQAAGAVRSLLGKNFGLPTLMSNHRVRTPAPAQGWHRDGGWKHGVELNYLQVFYYPQACTFEMGPTALLPGSHFLFSQSVYMGHYGSIRGTYYAVAPAGSIFITVYSIWHRRSASSVPGLRNLLKYNYWRLSPPERDWIVEPDFDFANADYAIHDAPTFREQFVDCTDAAHMFMWLCGQGDHFSTLGGQAWPLRARHDPMPYGVPSVLLNGSNHDVNLVTNGSRTSRH